MPDGPSVHVIDDDAAVRDSLAFLLATADFSVRTYDSAIAFLETVSTVADGCIITDIRMPGLDGLSLLRKLKEMGIAIPVIVITGHGDVPLAVEAMKVGAADFLEKPFDDNALLSAVKDACNRQKAEGERESERRDIADRIASLSNREHQVLNALVLGHANKIIAFDLGISPRTVEIYRANVMTKMQANSLSELVRMAMIAGVTGKDAAAG